MKRLRIAGVAVFGVALLFLNACGNSATAGKEIESHHAKGMVIALLNEKGDLSQGQNQFVIAFRSDASNQPVDVGQVTVNSTMAMPGMAPMSAGVELEKTAQTGQYLAKGDFAMSGSWHFEVRWDGPAGKGSATFNSNVR